MKTPNKLTVGILIYLLLGSTTLNFAQDLGEIARKNRERKASAPQQSTYVYTNEDLERDHILVPEDRVRLGIQPPIPVYQATTEAAQAASAETKQADNLTTARDVTIPVVVKPVQTVVSPKVENHARTRIIIASTNHDFTGPAPVIATTVTSVLMPQIIAARSQAVVIPAKIPETPVRIVTSELVKHLPATAIPAKTPEPAVHTVIADIPKQMPATPPSSPAASAQFTPVAQTTPVLKKEMPVASRELWGRILREYSKYRDSGREIRTVSYRLPQPKSYVEENRSAIPSVTPIVPLKVRVRRGDTLWKMARIHTGSAFAWNCIAAANPRIREVHKLYVGQMLVIPPDCAKSRENQELRAKASKPPAKSVNSELQSSLVGGPSCSDQTKA